MIYLLDTNTINYILKQQPQVLLKLSEALMENAEVVLCQIVHYEIVRYLKLKGSNKLLQFYTNLVTDWRRIEIVGSDWDTAIDLWVRRHSQGRPIADADLLIAVAALKVNAILVTNNEKDFQGLGLTIENWT